MLRCPRQCELCRRWGPDPLCDDCVARFAPARPRCPRCALPTPGARVCGHCLREPPHFDRVLAAADYAFPWDGLIARFKFRDQPELAACLAQRLVAEVCRSRLDDPADAASGDHPGTASTGSNRIDLVLPVPLGRRRLHERGYNQAWELARRIGTQLAIPADATVLARTDDDAHQVGAGRAERERNLRGSLWVEPRAVRRVAGQRVAVVDDVMTTGATAQAAARALKLAGALQVQVWVLARTPAAA